jgi:predicted helicase
MNKVICCSTNTSEFSCLMVDCIPDLGLLGGTQCFPLYLYEDSQGKYDLFDDEEGGLKRRDAIGDDALEHFQRCYDNKISKADIFYYTYGLLHHPQFRSKFSHNLSKELPRIPRVKSYIDFFKISNAGSKLSNYHLNYEQVRMFSPVFEGGHDYVFALEPEDFYVKKMKFGKSDDGTIDKTKVIFNAKIKFSGIPIEAYDYIVNKKPAIEWVMERQSVTTHKDSGIVNDANDWANETMGNPRYALELFLKMVTVSLETEQIIKNMPPLIFFSHVENDNIGVVE